MDSGLVPFQCSGRRYGRSTRKLSRPASPTTCSCSRQLSNVSRRYGCRWGGHHLGSADRVWWRAQDGLGAHQGLVSSCMWLFTVKCWSMLEPGEEYVIPPASLHLLPRTAGLDGLGLCRADAKQEPLWSWPWRYQGNGTVTGTVSRGQSCSETTRKATCNQEATDGRDACRDMCEVLRQQAWAYRKDVQAGVLGSPSGEVMYTKTQRQWPT